MGPFTWEALVGLLAVIGAVIVGLRQMSLTRGQTKLQEQQLRLDLFDRRATVFDAVEKFINRVLIEGKPVKPGGEEHEFLVAKMNARFLFSQAVNDHLQEIWKRHCEFHAVQVTMDHKYETEGTYGKKNIQSASAHLQWFLDASHNLANVFAEMKPLN